MENAAQGSQTQRKACIVCQREYSGELTNCPVDNVALTVLEVPRDPMVGTLFCDRFQITEVLGGGGMGMVYRATHLMMQRSVAIKILHTKMLGNADALKRFKVEAHAASNFSHPNILNVHDFGVSNSGQPYMVMDFLEGINLTALLDAEKYVPPARAINMFLQISSALAHAHSKDIIHRDVKPSNIMLVDFEGRRDFVKLVDFGIAKVLNPSTPEAENLTRTGEVFGSPLYMSPEQCQGKKLDARADIYSLGAVMYRVVTGKPIFESSDPLETMFRQVSEMPAAFAKACPDLSIPVKLESVIFKCLAKDREHRYQSMNDLRVDLEAAAAEIKAQTKTIVSANTIALEPQAEAASDLNADGWLSDLSENTGALPIDRSVITDNLTSPHAAAAASAPHPAPSLAGSDKRDETISIIINKKLLAIGGAALFAVLGLTGFFVTRASGPPAAPPAASTAGPKFVPDSQFSSVSPIPTIEGAGLAPAKSVVVKKPVTAVNKPTKRKQSQKKWQGGYPSVSRTGIGNQSARSNAYNSGKYTSPGYQASGAAQPVVQPAPVFAAPPIQQSAAYDSSSKAEQYAGRYASRYANKYADRGLDRVTNSKPGRKFKGLLNRGLGLLKDIAD